MKWLIVILVLAIALIAGCAQQQANSNLTQTSEITTSSTNLISCAFPENSDIKNIIIYSRFEGRHEDYDIFISGNGSAYYLDEQDPNLFFNTKSGNLSEEKIKELISTFRDENFFCLNDTYLSPSSPQEWYWHLITIRIDNVTKTVVGLEQDTPSQFKYIVEELKNSIGNLPSATPSKTCYAISNYIYATIYNELNKNPYAQNVNLSCSSLETFDNMDCNFYCNFISHPPFPSCINSITIINVINGTGTVPNCQCSSKCIPNPNIVVAKLTNITGGNFVDSAGYHEEELKLKNIKTDIKYSASICTKDLSWFKEGFCYAFYPIMLSNTGGCLLETSFEQVSCE